MAKYRLSKKAVEDLANIWEYTYQTWSEKQADKYYRFLIDNCKDLAKNPSMGKIYGQIDHSLLGYKTQRHIIFYKIVSNEGIDVLRILHARMDLKPRLEK